MISSALIANGVHIFGHHAKDGSPQGIFCANGQCSQCLVIADGRPVKACMTPLREGLSVASVEGLPRLPEEDAESHVSPIASVATDVLIIGGGPAGLSAAIELGKLGVATLIVDDKDRLGGKLVLQTHKFFGSVEDSYAGTRGFEIGNILAAEIAKHPSVEVWLNTTAVAVFADRIVGVVQRRRATSPSHPAKLMVATGAREKMLSFPGNTLPGVYGAGAFQTLVNRDLVKSSSAGPHRRRRQRRPDRRLPCHPGRHRGGGPDRGPAPGRRLQGPRRQAHAARGPDLHPPHHRLRLRRRPRGVGHHRRARRPMERETRHANRPLPWTRCSLPSAWPR